MEPKLSLRKPDENETDKALAVVIDGPGAKASGLPSKDHALLFCADEQGEHWTVATSARYEVQSIREHIEAGDLAGWHGAADMLPTFFDTRTRGWPGDWVPILPSESSWETGMPFPVRYY
jgi:hypothetical protein